MKVDASHIRKRFHRGSLTSVIEHLQLSNLGINESEFKRVFFESFHNAGYDHYDVATIIEADMSKHFRVDFLLLRDEWNQCYADLMGTLDQSEKVKSFWKSHLGNKIEDTLGSDYFDKIKPFRSRACYRYRCQKTSYHTWDIEPLENPIFTQETEDLRARRRQFTALPQMAYSDSNVFLFIASICEIMSYASFVSSPDCIVTLHAMRTYAHTEGRRPAPEGIHHDGSDFIVSACVVERNNVIGGESKIYQDADGKVVLFEHTLQEGEVLFQADNSAGLWHEVTPVYPINTDKASYRSIVGLDIELIK